jgi:NAD(P)-dependent dehydrogenase (short-subunit alcohol dehydrogenase family)
MKLHDKVAVLTGGNSGIGLAIAREFKKNGAKIAIFGPHDEWSFSRRRCQGRGSGDFR